MKVLKKTVTVVTCTHIATLLGNVLGNKFPRTQILGKQSVATLRNSR
jgi:hypothetical protein